MVGLGKGGSFTGAIEDLADFVGDALGDFLSFFFFELLGDVFVFFFLDGLGPTSSSASAALFDVFASGVSLGLAFGLGEGVPLFDFRFFGVDFALGVGVSSGTGDSAACRKATVPVFSEAAIWAESNRPAIPPRMIPIVSQAGNRITGARVIEARAGSSGLWFRRAIFGNSLLFATQNSVQLAA